MANFAFFRLSSFVLILAVFYEPFSAWNNCNDGLVIKTLASEEVIFENLLPSCFVVAQLAL